MTNLSELLTDCDAHGIRLIPADDCGLTIDAPQGALTPAVVARLKAHKAELLALLRPMPAASIDDDRSGQQDRDRGGHEDQPHGRIGGDNDDLLDEVVGNLSPCPTCGSLELWETLAGTWRCQHCDVAAFRRSLELAELAARLREQSPPLRQAPTGQPGRPSWILGPVAASDRPGTFPGL